jgi:hypothetical protein
LRYYEPDFVALTGDGIHYIVETKGLEDTNVANKDRAALTLVREHDATGWRAMGLFEGLANSVQAASTDSVWFWIKRGLCK